MRNLLLLVMLLFGLQPTYAQPGFPDLGFGNAGRIIYGLAANTQGISIACLQGDTLMVAGMHYDPVAACFLARYLPDGSPDPGFGVNGIVTINNNFNYGIYCMAVKPNGKILLAGSGGPNPPVQGADVFLMQCHPDGNIDSSFGQYGFVQTDMDSTNDFTFDIAIQPDGKILLGTQAMYLVNTMDADFGLVRYLENGVPDGSFGNGGKIIMQLGSGLDISTRVILNSQNKIILAGNTIRPGNSHDLALLQLNSDGSPDSNFGINGLAYLDYMEQSDILGGITTDSIGNIYLAAITRDPATFTDDRMLVARINPTGQLDQSYGGGYQEFTIGNEMSGGYDIKLDKNNEAVVLGQITANGYYSHFLLKLDAAGDQVPSFGTNGFAYPADSNGAIRMSIQADNKIVLTGTTALTETPVRMSVRRYGNDPFVSSLPSDLFSKTSINIYPNPASDLLQIDLGKQPDGPVTFRIMDDLGRINSTGLVFPNANSVTIDITDLVPGPYHLQFIAVEATATKSFIKR